MLPPVYTLNESLQYPKLLVFDLDGTLIDSRKDLAKAVNATLEHCSRRDLANTIIHGFIGDGAAMLLRRSLEATGEFDDALLDRALAFFLHFYRHHLLDHTHVYPGTLEALSAIRRQAPMLPMAVLTNKPVGPSRRICEALGLAPFFFANYGGDSFFRKKPDPEGLLKVIHDVSNVHGPITPAQTVVIGDSDVDVKTARAAGARCVGCLYGFAPEALVAARPDCIVTSPREWPNVLGLAS